MKLILLLFLTTLLVSICNGMGNNNKGQASGEGNGQGNKGNKGNGNKGNGKGNGNGQGNKNQGNGNKDKKVVFYPCKTSVLKEVRKIGGNPNQQRTWDGFLDISSVTQADKVIVTMIFNYPLQFTLDPEHGEKLKGTKGNYVRFVVFPDVQVAKFVAKGRPNEGPLNVVSLRINDVEVCENSKQWDDKAPLVEMLPPLPPRGSIVPVLPPMPELQPEVTTTTQRPKPQSTCGVRQIKKQAYVTNGYASTPGDWPWHAALYHKSQRSLSYKCGGTLINEKTVITAAHCLFDSGAPITPARVIIQLGKYNLQFNDVNTAEYQVFEIVMHEKYSNFDYNDDIALLKLSQIVEFTRFIQPCCLYPGEKQDLDYVVGKKGFVVGWGLQEDDDLADTLTEATMPIIDSLTCLNSNRDFFGSVISNFNYCAGYKNGTSVCNGDSGGGMFLEEGGIWYLRGLVSFSAVREDRNVCNPLEYVVFTDVAKYLDWIQEHI